MHKGLVRLNDEPYGRLQLRGGLPVMHSGPEVRQQQRASGQARRDNDLGRLARLSHCNPFFSGNLWRLEKLPAEFEDSAVYDVVLRDEKALSGVSYLEHIGPVNPGLELSLIHGRIPGLDEEPAGIVGKSLADCLESPALVRHDSTRDPPFFAGPSPADKTRALHPLEDLELLYLSSEAPHIRS